MKQSFSSIDPYLFFHYCSGVGPKRFSLIKQAFGSAEIAYQAEKKQWLKIGFPAKLTTTIFAHKNNFDLAKTKEDLAHLQINYLAQDDEQFPKLLKELPDCPIGLFIKGNILPQDAKALAVVGTRKVTNYGKEVTEKFVSTLVSRGFTIISGLARGVDSIAHKTALNCRGRTIAVMGCGLDTVYPKEHKDLANEIIKNGAIISEFLPYTEITPGNFPARNRIVSGMSLGVLVTEGSTHSGTNITAMMAVEQNREVFAIPGPITSQMSQGPAKLIQMGAKLALSVDDILNELQLGGLSSTNTEINAHSVANTPHFDDKKQELIWQFLLNGNCHIDNISRTVKIPITEVMTALTLMELKGLVKNLGEGVWMGV